LVGDLNVDFATEVFFFSVFLVVEKIEISSLFSLSSLSFWFA
jgi:hypothetical protein